MRAFDQKKLQTTYRFTKILALAAAGAWLAGCSSAGYHRSDVAARSLGVGAADVQAESRSLEGAMWCLDDLANKPSGDLRPQFHHFSAALDRLTAAAQRARTSIQQMDEKNAAYFAAWDRDLGAMNYEAVRSRSEARRAEVAAHFEEVNRRFQDTQTVMEPLISYLEDLRVALSADLTVSGLEAIKPIVTNAQQNAAKVQLALGRLSEELANSSVSMSSIATAQSARRE